ncbi:MAG: enoyl-CoA hydratase/isomerase family protein [Thermodesulfobacteriota bacterium]
MKYLDLKKDGNVFVITLIDGENKNTFRSEALVEYNQIFDEIEGSPGNASMVITSSDPKFFSNGINLQWFSSVSVEERNDFLYQVKMTLLRASTLNLPTIACITGHAYAMGAIMASSMDFRIMRADRSRFCFPEATYGMPLDDPLIALINNLSSPAAVNEMVLSGKALTGEECLEKGLVHSIYPESELFEKAMAFARDMASKERSNYALIKNNLKKSLKDMYNNWCMDAPSKPSLSMAS